ncbi:MAG: hypothetical protein R2748_22335 [Bryobacterales bacterium]
MRTVDWIETCSELDLSARRLHGYSGGGTITTFALGTRAPHQGGAHQRLPQHLPRQHLQPRPLHRQLRPRHLELREMYDVASLIAPRPLFVESGEKDDIFPIEARRQFARVKKVFTK